MKGRPPKSNLKFIFVLGYLIGKEGTEQQQKDWLKLMLEDKLPDEETNSS